MGICHFGCCERPPAEWFHGFHDHRHWRHGAPRCLVKLLNLRETRPWSLSVASESAANSSHLRWRQKNENTKPRLCNSLESKVALVYNKMTLQSIRVVLSHWHVFTVSTVSALAFLFKTFRPTHRIPASTTWTQVSKSCGFTSTRPAFSNLGALLRKLSTFSQKVQKDWIWKTSKSIEILSVSSSKWGLTITKYSTPIKQQYQKQHSYLSMSIHLNDVSFHMISYVCYSYHRFSSLGFLKVQAGPCAREVAHLEALHSPSHPGSKDTSKITMERWIWMIF